MQNKSRRINNSMSNHGSKMTQTSLWKCVYLHIHISIQTYMAIFPADIKFSLWKKKYKLFSVRVRINLLVVRKNHH